MKREKIPARVFPVTFSCITFHAPSLKIIHHDFFHERLHALLDKFQMFWMSLINMFRVLVGKTDVQRNLVALLNHRPMTRHHFANVKRQHARNIFQKPIRAREHLIGSVGPGRIRPENNNM
jgi:hypothetical protein